MKRRAGLSRRGRRAWDGAMWPRRYRLEIDDELDDRFAESFEGMTLLREEGRTVLVGPVRDQAQLQGLLLAVSRLGLSIRSVTSERDPS